ncbi:HalD/BesD family halogenase [Kiloniella sp.]|uniref:HalD/BesD family halogenase n=1 Tax=Kiloniella sp. TaxID=1938587 RepID=UPI003B0193F4
MALIDPTNYIDLNRYPLSDPSSPSYQELLSGIHADLAEDGCAVLRGFIRPERIPELIAEADAVAAKGHRSFSRTNAYFTQDDPSLPESHPLRRFYDRSNSFVPADNFPDDTILRNIYEWSAFPNFIQAALGEDNFYRYADPLADVIINTVEEGGGFPWHFDTNNFTVTLAIQNGLEGGEFEYCPNIRNSRDENYPAVQEVLEGTSNRVKTLRLEPGDLQIFKGRFALHRVKPVEGDRKRYVAIFSYVEADGMVGSPERTKQLYGRVLPIHIERAGLRTDNLVD